MEKQLVKIGADEIILWLRKNGIASTVPNDGIDGLGRKIHDLIVDELEGEKVEESAKSYWDETDECVHELGLPKTSAQYKISAIMISRLYLTISSWR